MLPWHEEPLRVFKAYLESGRMPHALLVSGSSGTGKRALASEIARTLLCEEGGTSACGSCRSCTLIAGGAHPDFRRISFEENPNTGKLRDVIVVGQIRRLIEAMYKTTTVSARKVAVIHPAERMHKSAANALLKTLEEPVGDTVLILVAHDAFRLPATVRSRCQRLVVKQPSRKTALEWLTSDGECDAGEAELALTAAAGSPLHARSLAGSEALEQYRGTMHLLNDLRKGNASDGKAQAAMAEFEPELVWTWLSGCCARLVRKALLEDSSGVPVQAIADLQKQADRNRRLTATPVRQDLLLRDWLIQWKNLPGPLPRERATQEA